MLLLWIRRSNGVAAFIMAFAALLTPISAYADGGAQPDDPTMEEALRRVDPELRPLAKQLGAGSALTDEIVRQIRAAQAANPPAISQDPPYFEKIISGVDGQPDVSIIVVNAKPGTSRPGILHTHGGGFVFGSAERYLPNIQAIASKLDITIVSVNYRLAPETTYYGSVRDNYAGLKWMYDHASELGVDPARIAIMGESAGGGHAALLAMMARDRGEVPVAHQFLLYPMLDDRTGSSRAPAPGTGELLWTAEHNRFGWRAFLGVEPGSDDVPADGVPARAASLEGLPPAYIAIGDIDLFAKEDIEFANRLLNAGIAVELHVFPGGIHGFDILVPNASISRQYKATLEAALRRALDITDSGN